MKLFSLKNTTLFSLLVAGWCSPAHALDTFVFPAGATSEQMSIIGDGSGGASYTTDGYLTALPHLAPGPYVFNYAAASFTVTQSGTYSFGTYSAPFDTVIVYYNGSFNSLNPLLNAVALNDDKNYTPTGVTYLGCQGNSNYCSTISNQVLVAGTRYVLLATVYNNFFNNLTSNLSTLGFWSEGPGSVIWSLTLSGPSAADTQSSIQLLAPKLRSGFTQQIIATNFANMNTYDCNLFDTGGLCISVGGQQTYVDNPSSNLTSTVVVAGYKISPTLRIGGFLNQNLNNHTSANVDISNANPLMGLFAVWNQNEDHLGYQVKVANAYQDKDVTTTRDITGTSEAGTGSTNLNTQSYVGELSYAFMANEDKTLVRPYAAVRYTRIKQDGYTEQTTAAVTAPLTYSALEDRSTAALVGVKLNHKLAEKVNLTGSLGIEQDIYHHVDNLTATGVSGLTSENFNNNIKRTRPVASIGAYFTPAKNQRISADLYYQQLPFQSTGSTTAYVNYTIGF